jgi:heptosyltransferase-2
MKILVVSPAWIGDAVMSHALIQVLKEQYPNSIIDVLAPNGCADVIRRMREVNRVHHTPFRHREIKLFERIKLGKSLRQYSYDWVIVTKNSYKSAIEPFFANIPKRTGWNRDFRYGVLNDIRRLDAEKLPLMVEQLMALGIDPEGQLPKETPRPQLYVDPLLAQQVAEKFNLSWKDKPVLALCPGAEFGPAKRWPVAYFAEIANRHINNGWQVWIFGGPKDQAIAANIMAVTEQGCQDLTGKTSIAEAIDLLSFAQLVISNDTGLMHIAASLDRPMLVIYGSSSPSFTPPLSDKAKAISLDLTCSPCFKRVCPLEHMKCLNHLTPDLVEFYLDQYQMNANHWVSGELK